MEGGRWGSSDKDRRTVSPEMLAKYLTSEIGGRQEKVRNGREGLRRPKLDLNCSAIEMMMYFLQEKNNISVICIR